jgi:predicted nucleotidyltransferase
MKSHIVSRLHEIEEQFNIKIILAVESGSRAWGFESPDSDYDVRFIYRHRFEKYLSVFPFRDVIDGQEIPITPVDDYVGWDLKKALTLMEKGNPQLFEWINSPIVYLKDEPCYLRLWEASNEYFSPVSSAMHYLHMARGNIHEFLEKGQATIPSKKYFYILRPLLAAMWVHKWNEHPPVEFERLLSSEPLTPYQMNIIQILLEQKRNGGEMGHINRVATIDEFIFKIADYLETMKNVLTPREKPPIEFLDQLFRDLIS